MTRETVQITEEIREAEESLIQIEYYKLSAAHAARGLDGHMQCLA